MILAFVAYKSLPKQYKNVQHWNSRKEPIKNYMKEKCCISH